MKKIILFLFLFHSVNFFSNTNAHIIDSLKQIFQSKANDTIKVQAYSKLSEMLSASTQDSALYYCNKGLELTKKIDYKSGLGSILNSFGKIYYKKGDYDLALDYYNRAIDVLKKVAGNDVKMATVTNNMAIVYAYRGDNEKAIEYYFKAVKVYEQYKELALLARTYNNIAIVYNQTKTSYDKALKYYNESLRIKRINNDKPGIAASLLNMGLVYQNQGKYDTAIKCFSESLKLRNELGDEPNASDCYTSIGMSKYYLGKYDESLDYYLKALSIYKKYEDLQGTGQLYGYIGESYSQKNDFNNAVVYGEMALGIAEKINVLEDKIQAFETLSNGYYGLKKYEKALGYYKKYAALKDSLFKEETSKQISTISTKYETEKKEKEIALLNVDVQSKQKDKELLETQVEKRNSIIYGTVSGALLLIASIVLLFNRRQLRQKNKHQSEIFKQQESTAISILEGQENERARIAKDLHDSVGTFLSTLKINLELFEGAIVAEKAESYHGALELIDKISAELRNIMKNLSDEILQEYGLVNAFEDLIARINRLGGTQFNFHSEGLSVRPENIIEINLYRVGQELLSNCIKYAKASNATLQLMARENKILLMLEDNGTGFDIQNPGSINKDHGMGLKNVRDRVSFIKGTVQIESDPVNGTTFIIETPQKIN
jgi:two-component system NarL family sensor kinase